MILAAGKGTRLRPLTDALAKPMVPVGDRPAIAHVVERVRLAASLIVVNVHHRPEDVAEWARGEGIAVSEERELLGTAGGVARAASLLGEGDVLVWNADILSPFDPREIVHRAAATLVVRERPRGEGNVGIGRAGIVRLRTESFGEEIAGGEFLGIHVIGASLRAACPEVGCLVGDVYLPALRRGETLDAHVTAAPFVDVGTIAQYLAANRAWLGDRASWAAPDARVSAAIDESVVGARAIVEAPALRSVVWPGARVTEAVSDAVVTKSGIARAARA
ncbi:MAG TPA: sugar phosphate nucleotidyltransferase [Labilithrix sp.]|jgi:mannose-1-phosphate guanylyltransferase